MSNRTERVARSDPSLLYWSGGDRMAGSPDATDFEQFVDDAEPRLRIALVAVFGQEGGRDATAAAFAYAWEHWDEVRAMQNPAGYLYRVGRSSQRRRREPRWLPVPEHRAPEVEPALPDALARLSEKQRLAVVLVHAYDWTRREVAETTGMAVSTVDSHLARGLARLRADLGVETHA